MTTPRPWYSHYIADYDQDTVDLTILEHGAYRLLLDHYYRTGGPLPANAPALHRVCRAACKKDRQAVDSVLARFFVKKDEVFVQCRADKELLRMADISRKRAKAAMQMHSNSSANAPAIASTLHTSHFTEEERLTPTGSSIEPIDPSDERHPISNGKTNGNGHSTKIERAQEFPNDDDIAEAVEHWNIKAAQFGLAQIEKMTGKRRSHLRARLRELGELGAWFGTINGMSEMPFLLGKVKDWKADFDWVINESNFRKIDEGKYRR